MSAGVEILSFSLKPVLAAISNLPKCQQEWGNSPSHRNQFWWPFAIY